jgi:hypothetical protein
VLFAREGDLILMPNPAHEYDGLEDHPITRPLAYCPVCGSNRLDPVVETERQTVHFLCRDCSRCWHVELGFVHLMTPATCFGYPDGATREAVGETDREHCRT